MKEVSLKVIEKRFYFIAMLFTILIAVCDPIAASPGNNAKLLHDVKKHIIQLVADGKVPSITVAVARYGKIIWEEGFGMANREKNIPATQHTAYALGSISKPLTATALLVLKERGLVNLYSPINNYLGRSKVRAQVGDATGATLFRVASHTSGLPLHGQHFYDGELYHPPPIDESIHRYGNLITAPGERYQYSNLGYGLLGYVISRLSGKSYSDFMRDEVFEPLGMDHTSVHLGPGLEKGQAVKYTADGIVVPPYDSDSPGSTAIYSSAHDLIRFGMFHLKNNLPDQKAIITANSIDLMHQSNPETGPLREWEREGSGYGIGWFVGITKGGLRTVHHNGGTVGVSTVLALVPKENLAVTVLSNTNSKWPDVILMEILGKILPDILNGLPDTTSKSSNERRFMPNPALAGLWKGFVYTYEGRIPLALEIQESGNVYATLGNLSRALLQNVSYRANFPLFLNSGGGVFLRGSMQRKFDTADVSRGNPYKLWLELKLRDNMLNGSLIAFSQRKFYSGPLTHWVEMTK